MEVGKAMTVTLEMLTKMLLTVSGRMIVRTLNLLELMMDVGMGVVDMDIWMVVVLEGVVTFDPEGY